MYHCSLRYWEVRVHSISGGPVEGVVVVLQVDVCVEGAFYHPKHIERVW